MGELRTIIGPNGAGKSTMLDIITGRTKPDSGKVEFGKDTDLTVARDRAREFKERVGC